MAAHRLVLAASSPFLRTLIADLGDTSAAGSSPHEPLLLVLPDVKVVVVQTLLEFLYTGQVTTEEGQFYSLMKLVYDLHISASIEAEKTNALPTKFATMPIMTMSGSSSHRDGDSHDGDASYGGAMRPRKRARLDTFESTISVLLEESTHSLHAAGLHKTGSMSQQHHHQDSTQQLWQKPLVVNSLTASGVEVKQEPEEKPQCEDDSLEQQQQQLGKNSGGSLMKANSYCLSGTSTLSTNSANNNSQLGHFVSVSPGYQVIHVLTVFFSLLYFWRTLLFYA